MNEEELKKLREMAEEALGDPPPEDEAREWYVVSEMGSAEAGPMDRARAQECAVMLAPGWGKCRVTHRPPSHGEPRVPIHPATLLALLAAVKNGSQ